MTDSGHSAEGDDLSLQEVTRRVQKLIAVAERTTHPGIPTQASPAVEGIGEGVDHAGTDVSGSMAGYLNTLSRLKK